MINLFVSFYSTISGKFSKKVFDQLTCRPNSFPDKSTKGLFSQDGKLRAHPINSKIYYTFDQNQKFRIGTSWFSSKFGYLVNPFIPTGKT
jgi:hypothetical protein